jgi:hypothetical protein
MDAREGDVNGCGCGTTSPASEQIEQDIGATRARLDSTMGQLQERLTVRNLANSAAHAAVHGAGVGSRAALRAIKNNPVPAALVGLGVAWLIMDKFRARSFNRATQRGGYGDNDWLAPGATYTPGGRGASGPSIASRIGEGASAAAHAVGDAARSGAHWARETGAGAAEWAKDKVSTAASGVSEKVSAGGSAIGEKASQWAHSGREMAGRAREGFWDTYDDNPLMIGAAAFAIGLVGGLSMPSCSVENRLMGRASKNLKDKVKAAGEEALEAGKQVASRAADSLQSSSSDADTIGGRLAGAASSITEAVADEAVTQADRVARKLGGSCDT